MNKKKLENYIALLNAINKNIRHSINPVFAFDYYIKKTKFTAKTYLSYEFAIYKHKSKEIFPIDILYVLDNYIYDYNKRNDIRINGVKVKLETKLIRQYNITYKDFYNIIANNEIIIDSKINNITKKLLKEKIIFDEVENILQYKLIPLTLHSYYVAHLGFSLYREVSIYLSVKLSI